MPQNSESSPKRVISNELFEELLDKQIKNVSRDKKLRYSDLRRICKYIDTSIFKTDKCCLWSGYITNINNANKGTYINFYFQKKKVALHRLLYVNFVDNLSEDEYLKFNCENKGKCCNVFHLKKFKYRKPDGSSYKPKKMPDNKHKTIKIINHETASKKELKSLFVEFD